MLSQPFLGRFLSGILPGAPWGPSGVPLKNCDPCGALTTALAATASCDAVKITLYLENCSFAK
jgi:hypothetical protein